MSGQTLLRRIQDLARRTSVRRVVLSCVIGALAAAWSAYLRYTHPNPTSDLDQVVRGAQAWLNGQNPYEVALVGYGDWRTPVLYPFTAILLFVPLSSIPALLLNAAWIAVSAGLLVWAVTRERLVVPQLVIFISAPFIHAVHTSQWTPLLVAAALLPWGGFLFACKPTTAVWLFAFRPNWRHIVTAVAALTVSLIAWPAWPFAWRTVFVHATYTISLLLVSGGPLILLSLLKWRRPEARLLAAMGCMPHTPLIYETLPLFLVPKTWIEAGVLWVGALAAVALHNRFGPYPNPTAWATASGVSVFWCMYIPTLIMILRRRNQSVD